MAKSSRWNTASHLSGLFTCQCHCHSSMTSHSLIHFSFVFELVTNLWLFFSFSVFGSFINRYRDGDGTSGWRINRWRICRCWQLQPRRSATNLQVKEIQETFLGLNYNKIILNYFRWPYAKVFETSWAHMQHNCSLNLNFMLIFSLAILEIE